MSSVTRRAFCAIAACAPLRAQVQTRTSAADPAAKDLKRSQLFLDDTWIEETYRLERVWQPAEIYPEPVLRPEKPWEGRQIVMFGSVFRLGGEWRMYYMTYNRPQRSQFCMATSTDGVQWERPNLGLAEWNGSRANNILWAPSEGEDHDGCTVCHDPGDPKTPFKLMYYGYGSKRRSGEYVAFSQDGIVWRHHREPVLTNTGDRTNVLPSRDHRGKFVAYLRHRIMMTSHRARTIWRSQSDDFLRWSDPEVVLRPDLLDDPNTELYGMAAVPYSDLYLGMLERWHGNPDIIEVQLAWSHDGTAWHRPVKRSAFIGPTYPWNRGWNSCANTAPVRVGNQLHFYFGGRSGAHGRESPGSYGAIGLASVTVDRFAALRADFREGLCITKPMDWPGGDLVLNCSHARYRSGHPTAGGGSIKVEVTDELNRPIEGFSGESQAQHSVISPAPWETRVRPVLWPQERSLRQFAGRRIRLVFRLTDASLYSFRAEAV
jgi:hypothetical protein